MKTILTKLVVIAGLFFCSTILYGQNLLSDGSFSTTTSITPLGAPPVPLNVWCSWHNEATVSSLSATVDGGVCRYSFSSTGKDSWEVQLSQYGFPLKLNNHYRLSFDVKADAERDFGVYLGEESGNWTDLLDYSTYWHHATTNWQTYTQEFVAYNTFPLHKFSLEIGNSTIPMSFDNIKLEDLGPVSGMVVIAGNFQSLLGCSYDWQADCAKTQLTYNPDNGMYTGTFAIPAGCYQYKVTVGGSWSVNYGENGLQGGANIKLSVPEKTDVTFTFDPWSHYIYTTPVNSGFTPDCPISVVLAGTFQSEAGCNSDWDPSCAKTALTYNKETKLFEGDITLPAGCYQYRVVENGDWVNNYGNNGTPFGNNYILSVLNSNSSVHFTYDPYSHFVISANNHNDCLPFKVVLAGSFQNEVGCSGDWMPDCSNTELVYSAEKGVYEADITIPKGCYEYKVVLNGNWAYNYGKWGIPNGENYVLSLPVKDDKVHFSYNPDYHTVTASYNSNVCQPGAVVIAGNFQSELGCAGDWMPDCDNTRMSYDPNSNMWIDTLLIPAGSWEYKVTIDNSWNENYGLYGQLNGPNIPLELCYPAKVVFRYNHDYHYVYTEIITGGICLYKFYDPNINGYPETGEMPMAGVQFTLSGEGITQTQITDQNGKASFGSLPNGLYTVKEIVPAGYYTTQQDSQTVFVYSNMNVLNFGNVCLGAGGAKGLGFWASKQGYDELNKQGMLEYALMILRSKYLSNDVGKDIDPYTYDEFRAWLKGANSKNMSYMLSAQAAVLWLNSFTGMISQDAAIYTGGCHTLYYSGKFMYAYWVTSDVDYLVMQYPLVLAGNPERANFECFKNAIEKANDNLTFVQPKPCSTIAVVIPKRPGADYTLINTDIEAKVWPNPSHDYFILRPSNTINADKVSIRVMDINGKEVYKTTGVATSDYKFGQQFKAGLYFVEIKQGEKRTTIKVVKQ